MSILVLFVLPYEAKPAIRALGLVRRWDGGAVRLYTGARQGSSYVNLVITPPDRAGAMGAKLLSAIDRLSPHLVIHAGFSGALVPELRCGDLIYSLSMGSASLAPLQHWPGLRETRMTSSSQVVEGVVERRALHAATGAHAVDLEGDCVRDICGQRGLPLIALRVISDSETEPLPVPSDVIWRSGSACGSGPQLRRLLFYLLPRPARWPAFIRAVVRWNFCRNKLAAALCRLIEGLSAASRAHPD